MEEKNKEGGKPVADVKKKVNVELEVDTSVKDLGPNPYAKLIHLARAVDSWRIFPRIFITTYIIRLLYKVVIWYMAIPPQWNNQVWLVLLLVLVRHGLVYILGQARSQTNSI